MQTLAEVALNNCVLFGIQIKYRGCHRRKSSGSFSSTFVQYNHQQCSCFLIVRSFCPDDFNRFVFNSTLDCSPIEGAYGVCWSIPPSSSPTVVATDYGLWKRTPFRPTAYISLADELQPETRHLAVSMLLPLLANLRWIY